MPETQAAESTCTGWVEKARDASRAGRRGRPGGDQERHREQPAGGVEKGERQVPAPRILSAGALEGAQEHHEERPVVVAARGVGVEAQRVDVAREVRHDAGRGLQRRVVHDERRVVEDEAVAERRQVHDERHRERRAPQADRGEAPLHVSSVNMR
jgi:hypothetical protein